MLPLPFFLVSVNEHTYVRCFYSFFGNFLILLFHKVTVLCWITFEVATLYFYFSCNSYISVDKVAGPFPKPPFLSGLWPTVTWRKNTIVPAKSHHFNSPILIKTMKCVLISQIFAPYFTINKFFSLSSIMVCYSSFLS